MKIPSLLSWVRDLGTVLGTRLAGPLARDLTLARGALVALAVTGSLVSSLAHPGHSHAITRKQILARAERWIDRDVAYSQVRYRDGYRQDCSGFVSMAWKLRTSYTTRTISAQARRVPLAKLRPGDAILSPGHIVIFGGWVDRKAGTFVSLEEANSRLDAVKRTKRLPRGAVGLRPRNVTRPKPAAKPSPAPAVTTTPAEDADARPAPARGSSLEALSVQVASLAPSRPRVTTAEPLLGRG